MLCASSESHHHSSSIPRLLHTDCLSVHTGLRTDGSSPSAPWWSAVRICTPVSIPSWQDLLRIHLRPASSPAYQEGMQWKHVLSYKSVLNKSHQTIHRDHISLQVWQSVPGLLLSWSRRSGYSGTEAPEFLSSVWLQLPVLLLLVWIHSPLSSESAPAHKTAQAQALHLPDLA